jgi:hypothetical protein
VRRVLDYVHQNPGKAVVEYAGDLLVAESVINLLIEHYLMDIASLGRIAVSNRGRKPNWYFRLTDPSIVPQRPIKRKLSRGNLRAISDKQLRLDYLGLINLFGRCGHRMSPAKLNAARHEFLDRVNHVAGSHQETIDNTADLVARLEHKMQGMEDAIQVMATAMTSISVKAMA